jgi:hypothetical protein
MATHKSSGVVMFASLPLWVASVCAHVCVRLDDDDAIALAAWAYVVVAMFVPACGLFFRRQADRA